jgi:hypothetical protein
VNDDPTCADLETRPDSRTLSEGAKTLRDVAAQVENVAWSLTVRDVGRTLARFSAHLIEDAQRLEMMALMVPALETLPEDKKDEIKKRFDNRIT